MKKLFLLILLPFAQPVKADIPDSFKELYQPQKKTISFLSVDGIKYSIKAMASYDEVKVTQNTELDHLQEILERAQIKKSYVDEILKDFSQGVHNTNLCESSPEKCVVKTDTYAVYYDYYKNTLYMWVSPDLYAEDYQLDKVVYAESHNAHPAFINTFSGYVGGGDSSDMNMTLYADSVLGLPYGYVESSLEYRSDNDDFDVDDFKYTLDDGPIKYRAGFSTQNKVFNTTDYLVGSSLNRELALEVGSSKDTILGGTQSQQKIFFYAQREGILTVYRGDKILLQKRVSEGQGFLTQDELPAGRYDITLEIKVAGRVVSKETKAVFNTLNDTLAINDFDYHLSVGQYKPDQDLNFDNDLLQEEIYDDMQDKAFARGLINYRLNNYISLGAGLTASEEGNIGAVGLKGNYEQLVFQGLLQYFTAGQQQYELYLNVGNLSFDYENYISVDNHDDSTLGDYLYGLADYQRFSATYSQSFESLGYTYITYSYTEQDASQNQAGYSSNYLSAGVTFPGVFDSTFDIGLDYEFAGETNEINMNINWSVPISELFNYRNSTSFNQNGVSQFSNYIESNDFFEKNRDFDMSASVGNVYNSDSTTPAYSTASINSQLRGDGFNSSLYGYSDTDGQRNYNVSFDSTQVVTADDINFTRFKRDSYVKVNTDNNIRFDRESTSRGLLVVKSNGKLASKKIIYKDKDLSPVTPYKPYQVEMDVDSVDLVNTGVQNVDGFAYPGTVFTIDTDLTKVVTFISGFNDIFENEMADVQCKGEGCVNITEIQNGIYKVSVEEGRQFALTSGDYACITPDVNEVTDFNLGKNYCVPNDTGNGVIVKNAEGIDQKIYIIGAFDNESVIEMVKEKFKSKENHFEVVEKSIGKYTYLYMKSGVDYQLSQATIDEISSLSKLAIKLTDKNIETAEQRN